MIYKKWFILVIFTLVLVALTAKGVIGYCNETITYEYANYTIDNQIHVSNTTNIKTCTEEYNNTSFIGILIAFLFFTTLVVVSMFFVKAVWVKTICVMGLSILLMSVTRFLSWFVSITNPAELELINTLDHYFMFSVWGFRIITIAAMFILIIIIINSIKDKPNKNKKESWENWGKE